MSTSNKIIAVPLSDIEISDYNVRQTDTNVDVDHLAESIKKDGLLQPVVLMGRYGNPPYKLLIGQRRYLAHKRLKATKIKAIFVDKKTKDNAMTLSLIENLHRVELNHADKAKAITHLYKQLGKNIARVANKLKLSKNTIRDYIKIEVWASPKAKKLLEQKRISKEDIKKVLRIAGDNIKKADALLDEMLKIKMTDYDKKRMVSYALEHPSSTAKDIAKKSKILKTKKSLTLDLTEEIEMALNKARRALAMENEEIAAKALSDWLKDNGFL